MACNSTPAKSVPVEIRAVGRMPDTERIGSWFNFVPYLTTHDHELELLDDLAHLAFASAHTHEGEAAENELGSAVQSAVRFGYLRIAKQLVGCTSFILLSVCQ
jgi:hypothetical protein